MGLLTFSNSTLKEKLEYEFEEKVQDSTSSEPSYIIVEEVESSVVNNMVESGELRVWWVMSICRCVLVSLAWVVFAVRPFTYRLLERLQELPGEADSPSSNKP